MKEDNWNQVLVAVHDEASGFFRRFGVDHAAKLNPLAALVVSRLRMQLLVGNDSYSEAADASISAYQGLPVLRLIFIEFAGVRDAGDDFFNVVGASRRGIVNSVDLLGGKRGRNRLLSVPGRLPPVSPLFDNRANAQKAGLVVWLVKIDCAADGGVHAGAAQFFGRDFLSNGSLDKSRTGEKETAAVGHQHVIAHNRQIT